MSTSSFAVLATLVAVNTLIFVTLAVGKMLPAIHRAEILHR